MADDMSELLEAAEERRFWKDVGKIAYGLGRREIVEAANRRAREIGLWMVERIEVEIKRKE